MAKVRRIRPKESHFDADSLVEKWNDLAALRAPGFTWDGSGYSASRTQALDEPSMAHYATPLKMLLEVAPTGFPAHKCLIEAFEKLHSRHDVLACEGRFSHRAATLASDAWRIMTKHLYNAKIDKKVLKNKSLQELLTLITLPASASQSRGGLEHTTCENDDAQIATNMSPSDVLDLFTTKIADGAAEGEAETELEVEETEPEAVHEDDVVFCSAQCRCPECMVTIRIDEDEDDLMEIPSAAIGGQRRDTKRQAQDKKDDAKNADGKRGGNGRKRKDTPEGTPKRQKPRLRVCGKRAPRDPTEKAPSKGKGKQCNGKGKGTSKTDKDSDQSKHRKKDKAAAEEPEPTNIKVPTKIIVRKPSDKRRGEAYLLDGKGSYVIGLTSKRSDEYEKLVEEIRDKFNTSAFTKKADATQWLQEQLAV